jgi:hypothetical protein
LNNVSISRLSWPSTVVFACFSVILGVFGWIGVREIAILDKLVDRVNVHEQLPFHFGTKIIFDQIEKNFTEINNTMKEIRGDLKLLRGKQGI